MSYQTGVTPKARIVYMGDEEAFASLRAAFDEAGYALLLQDDGAGADIGLIDLRGKPVSGKQAQSIANLLRRKSPESSVIIIVDPFVDATARSALQRHGELVTLGTEPDALITSCRRVLRLRNISEETGERIKTLTGLSRLNEFPPVSSPSTPLRVLIAGEPGAPALSGVNALRPVTESCVCVFSAGQAMRALEAARFDCAVFLPSGETDPLLSLAKALRRHPKHNSLPIIFPLYDSDDAGLYTPRGATDFILSPHVSTDLALKTQLVARRSRLLKSMRRFLNSCEGDSIRDTSSGAFTSTFLSEHGARLCARSDQTGRPLSLIALRLTGHSKRPDAEKLEPRALQQATRIINRVTRAEDTTARIAADKFLVMAPATTVHDAEQAALRIKGVMENTVFRSIDDEELYGVTLDVAAITRPEGHCLEESVALAINALNEASISSSPSLQSQQ